MRAQDSEDSRWTGTPSIRLLFFLFILIGLSLSPGCLDKGPSTGTDPSGEETEGWREGTARGLNLSLEHIPVNSSWVLIEVQAAGNGSLEDEQVVEMQTSFRFPVATDARACFGTLAAGDRLVLFGGWGSYAEVTATPVSEDPVYEQEELTPGQSFHLVVNQDFRHNTTDPLYVVLSAVDRETWADQGATIYTRLDAGEPLKWRPIAHGQTTCLSQIDEFPQGDVVTVGSTTVARDLQAGFELERYGFGSVGVSGNLEYEAELDGPNGTVWSNTSATTDATGDGRGEYRFSGLGPGNYTFNVPRVSDSEDVDAGWHILDLPRWATEYFRQEGYTQP